MSLGIDPKILVGALVALAALLFWYNSRGTSDTGGAPVTTPAIRQNTSAPAVIMPGRTRTPARRQKANADRGVLRLRPVDPTRGDIDPTIRLDLLAKVRSSDAPTGGRNLFEIGAAPVQAALPKITGPIITPKPLGTMATSTRPTTIPLQVNIPLKYYGFVRSPEKNQSNRGLFLDGENVLVGAEGEVVKGRYLVVELTPNTARMEDTQLKQGQTLTVVPVAMP